MTTTPAEQAGLNIRVEMVRKSVTQAQLATALGMSQTSVSSRLRGKIAFDVNDLTKTAAFLGVAVTDLLPVQVAA